jgi:hypothetical protein
MDTNIKQADGGGDPVGYRRKKREGQWGEYDQSKLCTCMKRS